MIGGLQNPDLIEYIRKNLYSESVSKIGAALPQNFGDQQENHMRLRKVFDLFRC